MALTKPQWNPALGAFMYGPISSPPKPEFSARGFGQVLSIPNNPAAQAEGAALDTVNNAPPPPGTSQRANASLRGTMVSGPEEPIPGIPPQEAIPAPLTSDQIAQIYKPLFAQIESQTRPPGQPLPPPTPAAATFLSVLMGSLGAHLTKDPRVQASIIGTLEDQDRRRQAIEDQNYANELLFNRERAMRRLAATGQQLESQFAEASKANDTDRMMKIQQNLEKLQGFISGRNVMLAGREQRKTAAFEAKLATEAGTQGEPPKTLEPKDYVAQRTEILKAKDIPEQTTRGFLGTGLGAKKIGRIEELANLDKEALHSGNPNTIAAAKRNIQQAVLKKLGLKMQANFDRKQSVAIRNALQELYDLRIEEVF